MIAPALLLALAFSPTDVPPLPALGTGGLIEVLHDQDAAGTLYSLGDSYKMSFGSDGARYYPRFGQRAERNFALHFSFGTPENSLGQLADAAVQPVRNGNRVTIDRGAFIEIYDLSLDSVEQSFLLPKRPLNGDLHFRVPLATELANLTNDGAGLRFGREDLGEVRYGDATIVDAVGNRVHASSLRTGNAIEIVVPDAFLDRAAFPIVIDPVIQTIAIDTGTDDMRNPDVAYSATNNVFVVVYERIQSASDTDLLQKRIDPTGALIEQITLVASTDNERDPAIAYASGNFLTAWRNTTAPVAVTRIKARNRLSANTTVHAIFDVSSVLDSSESEPDVGATSQGAQFPFVITYLHLTSAILLNQSNVVAQPANSSGISDSRAEFISPNFEYFANVHVTQQVRFGGRWLVVYEAEDNPLVGPPEFDIKGFLVDPATGSSVGGPFDICDTPNRSDLHPDAGGDGVDLLVAWETKDGSNDSDLLAQRYRFSSGLTALGGIFSLSDLDHGGPESLDQLEPQIGFDGARFAVAYREAASGAGNFDIIASTFLATGTGPFSGSQLAIEKRTALAKTATIEFHPAITSAGFDQAGLHLVAWTEQLTASNRDVRGSLFSSLGAGNDAITVQTGCGAPEPALITSAQAVIGGGYQILIGNVTNHLLLIGIPTTLPLCPGQAGCILGVSPLTMIPTPTFLDTSIPADPGLVGATFALQVVDLLPAGASGSLCGPPKYSQKFRVSDTRVTTIR